MADFEGEPEYNWSTKASRGSPAQVFLDWLFQLSGKTRSAFFPTGLLDLLHLTSTPDAAPPGRVRVAVQDGGLSCRTAGGTLLNLTAFTRTLELDLVVLAGTTMLQTDMVVPDGIAVTIELDGELRVL